MPDRRVVLTAAKCIANKESEYVRDCIRRGCPYAKTDCCVELIKDVYDLLEPLKPEKDSEGTFYCGYCRSEVVGYVSETTKEWIKFYFYCPNCGREVRWNG